MMHAGMALRAQRDQVLLGVVAGMAAKLFVVDSPGSTLRRTIDTASRRAAESAAVEFRRTLGAGAGGEGRVAPGS
jgi:hypothetical protein